MTENKFTLFFNENKNYLILLSLYIPTLLFFCSKMSPLFPYNEWPDVNIYYNMAKAMLEGKVLYTDVFDHKGPCIFFIYALGYLISPHSFVGMFIIQIVFWLILAFTAYATAKLFVNATYAFFTATLLPVLLLSNTSYGGSAEEFILVCACISLYLFISYFKNNTTTHSPLFMSAHGVLFAITLFTKINLTIFWFFPLLAIFVTLLRNKAYKNLFNNSVALIVGVLIVAAPICLYLIYNNALSDAYSTYITLNRSYARMDDLRDVFWRTGINFYHTLKDFPFDFIIILFGCFYFPIKQLANKLGAVALILSAISIFFILFVLPIYLPYYSIPCYIFALPGCISIFILLDKFGTIRIPYVVAILASICCVAWGISKKGYINFENHVSVKPEYSSEFVQIFGAEINKCEKPTLLNLGLDWGNLLFTLHQISPTTKYFVSPNLAYNIYPTMRNEETTYIENKKTEFVVLALYSFNYQYFKNLPALALNYELINEYTMLDGNIYYLYKKREN